MKSPLAALLLPAVALCGGAAEPVAPLSAEEIRRLVRELSDADFEAREAAFQALMAAGVERPETVLGALPAEAPDVETAALVERLRAGIPKGRFRREMMRAFEGTPILQGVVGDLLERPSPHLLRNLPGMIRERRDRLVPIALHFLKEPDAALQLAALDVLALSGANAAPPEIKPLLSSPNDEVRHAALQCLHAVKDRSTASWVAPLVDDPALNIQVVAIQTLGDIGGPAEAERLLDRMGHPMEIVRQCAAQALAKIKDPAVTKALLALLESESAEKREVAVIALYHAEDRSSLDAIERRLSDESPQVRVQAGYAFCHLNDRTRIPKLRAMLADPDPKVRSMAIRALSGGLKDRESAPAVAALLRDPVPDVRRDALFSLHPLLEKGSAPFLAAALDDEDASVTQTAAELLSHVARRPWSGETSVRDARAWWKAHLAACKDPKCPYACKTAAK